MTNPLAGVLSEDNGQASMTRLINLLVTVVVLGNWSFVNISDVELHNLDTGSIGLIVATLTAKVFQKKTEENVSRTETTVAAKELG